MAKRAEQLEQLPSSDEAAYSSTYGVIEPGDGTKRVEAYLATLASPLFRELHNESKRRRSEKKLAAGD
jgi:hypothetical protein